jgi:hypothetical protein
VRPLIVPRLITAAALAIAMLGAGASAHATEPIPDFVEYTGTGSTQGFNGGATGPYPADIRIECPGGACFIASAHLVSPQYDWDLTQGRTLELVNGHGEWEMEEWGDICGAVFWAVGGPMIVDADAEGITITRNGRGTANDPCLGEAAGLVEISFTGTVTGTVSGGNACVLDGSCPAGEPVTSPGQSGADDPGTLSTLPTVASSARPGNILWAVGFAVVLVLLVAFPTHLLNTAAEHGTDRFSTWWTQKRATKRALPPALEKLNGWPLAIAGVVVASIVSAFVDPSFGQDAGGSLRILGSILLAFALDVALGWVLLLLFLRRTMPDAKARLRFAPASLLLVAAAVVFSRITGFQPGIVFGLVAGVVIGATLATAAKARVALIGLGYSFAAGLLAWIFYAIVTASGPGDSAGALFVQETLSAVAIGGMAVLPVALFPLRGMTGYDIFSWNRIVWGIAYAVGLIGFFFVLMPMPFAWQGVPLELGVWVGLYLVYAVAAVAIWAFITRPWDRGTPDDKPATKAAKASS